MAFDQGRTIEDIVQTLLTGYTQHYVEFQEAKGEYDELDAETYAALAAAIEESDEEERLRMLCRNGKTKSPDMPKRKSHFRNCPATAVVPKT
jgi:hypothetical protein